MNKTACFDEMTVEKVYSGELDSSHVKKTYLNLGYTVDDLMKYRYRSFVFDAYYKNIIDTVRIVAKGIIRIAYKDKSIEFHVFSPYTGTINYNDAKYNISKITNNTITDDYGDEK